MGNAERQTLTETARNNRTAMMCHTIEVIVISLAYVLEVVKGFRTLGYLLMTIFLGGISPVAEWIFYKKDKEHSMIMHLVGIGFAVFYIFIMMTTTSTLAFTYAVPMLVAVSVYNKMSFKLPINIGVIIVNIIQAGMFLAKGVYSLDNLANLEIQVIVMIVITLYSVYTSKTLAENNAVKVKEISHQGEKTERLLSATMDISAKISEEIVKINEKIEILNEAILTTSEAMNEVTDGSTDTAEAVQDQLLMTQNIQNRVEDVSRGSEQIGNAVGEVKRSVASGKVQIADLLQQVQNSVDAGKRVTLDLERLQSVMDQMNSVVDIITEITSQTSLLSLNASIEAARAGEAGKGFAVVATEISKLADQTQQATEQITEMIENVSGAIDDVAKVTGQMVEDISGQMTSTNQTAESFYAIEHNTEAIVSNSNRLEQLVQQLADANNKIMDSISTISAISQQVSAHATDTAEVSAKNSETVGEVLEISRRLQELAEQLNQ